MIEVRGLTKRYGDIVAVDGLTFDVQPGKVTGFLGPNGAGKSTTMRIILGLDHATHGTAHVHGRAFREFAQPLREVGALLSAEAVHPGRTGRNHLRVAARSNGIPLARVDEVIGQVGLDGVASRRVKGYSLGMRQRLGIAAALLGDPGILLFDEPVNGLDVDGVRWVRSLMRRLAQQGRTVLVSSHLMSEMQQTADRVVIIRSGRLVADASIEEILGRTEAQVLVRTPRPGRLRAGLAEQGMSVHHVADGELLVRGATAERVGETAHRLGVPLHALAEIPASLEEAYLGLTELTELTGPAATQPLATGAGQ